MSSLLRQLSTRRYRHLLLSAGACSTAPAARQQLSIDIFCPHGAQQQTRRPLLLLQIDGTDHQTDRRTSDRYTDLLRILYGQRQKMSRGQQHDRLVNECNHNIKTVHTPLFSRYTTVAKINCCVYYMKTGRLTRHTRTTHAVRACIVSRGKNPTIFTLVVVGSSKLSDPRPATTHKHNGLTHNASIGRVTGPTTPLLRVCSNRQGPTYFAEENVKFHGGFWQKMPDFTEISRKAICCSLNPPKSFTCTDT